MDLIPRIIERQIKEYLTPNRVVVILGPRRVGKTVLIRKFLSETTEPHVLLNGEDITTRELFARRSVAALSKIIADKRLLVIDEAQKVPDIGNALKLMVDEITGLKVMITGSSAFDVENYTGEPLTGRKMTFKLFGISEQELLPYEALSERKDNLYERLVFGNYPEVFRFKTHEAKSRYLRDLLNAYLLKDILSFETIRNSEKIFDLLRLIGFQIGNEVSIPELANALQMSRNTVEKYLDLLTKVFIIYKVNGFSRNLRKEVSKSSRYYFLDNGIRNVIVGNLKPVGQRGDIGALWENYMVSERIKYQQYTNMLVYNYFWRTYDQQEIDWVEDRGGQLHGYEFKWNTRKRPKAPAAWSKSYPEATFTCINPDTYEEWLHE